MKKTKYSRIRETYLRAAVRDPVTVTLSRESVEWFVDSHDEPEHYEELHAESCLHRVALLRALLAALDAEPSMPECPVPSPCSSSRELVVLTAAWGRAWTKMVCATTAEQSARR